MAGTNQAHVPYLNLKKKSMYGESLAHIWTSEAEKSRHKEA